MAFQIIRHRSRRKTDSIEDMLKKELERLRKKAGLNERLRVIWQPGADRKLSGKVEGDVLFIYEKDKDLALKALKHEFIDYLVSQAIEPYRSIANKLVQLINEICYKKKEEVIEALLKLL